MEDILSVAFDDSGDDEPAICIVRKLNGDSSLPIKVLKMEIGEQANMLYQLLTDQTAKAEALRGKGKWLLEIEDWNKWICSNCGYHTRTDIHVTLSYNFCPKCGADMREGVDYAEDYD